MNKIFYTFSIISISIIILLYIHANTTAMITLHPIDYGPYSTLCFNRSVNEFSLYSYHGTSMVPLYVPGDRVFVFETNNTSRLLPGVIVVAVHPLHGRVLHKVTSVDALTGVFTLRGIANGGDDVYLYRPVDFVGYACGVLYGYR